MKYLLDTKAIHDHPGIISPGLPWGQIADLSNLAVASSAYSRDLSETSATMRTLIEAAIGHGLQLVLAAAPTLIKLGSQPAREVELMKLGRARDTFEVALSMVECYREEVTVVTLDPALSALLRKYKIEVTTPQAFLSKAAGERNDPHIVLSRDVLRRQQVRFGIASVIAGALAAGAGSVIYLNAQLIAETISIWGALLGLPTVGVVLFWFRQRNRLAYGVFEFFFGVFMSCYPFLPVFSVPSFGIALGVQVLGGLYAMVRGLDNIGKGLEGKPFVHWWKRWFAERPSQS